MKEHQQQLITFHIYFEIADQHAGRIKILNSSYVSALRICNTKTSINAFPNLVKVRTKRESHFYYEFSFRKLMCTSHYDGLIINLSCENKINFA